MSRSIMDAAPAAAGAPAHCTPRRRLRARVRRRAPRSAACCAPAALVSTGERKLAEKYAAEPGRHRRGGEYPLQDGFGWSHGVTLARLDLYPPAPAVQR
ncbi:MAG: trehalase family glycosidase [Pseudoxanthomonas sp.]